MYSVHIPCPCVVVTYPLVSVYLSSTSQQQHTPPVIKQRGSGSGGLARSSSSNLSNFGKLSRASSSSSVSAPPRKPPLNTTPPSPRLGRSPSGTVRSCVCVWILSWSCIHCVYIVYRAIKFSNGLLLFQSGWSWQHSYLMCLYCVRESCSQPRWFLHTSLYQMLFD